MGLVIKNDLKMKTIKILLLSFTLFSKAQAQDTILLKKYIGNLKQAEVTINGKPYAFLFDTGGGETFISNEIAKSLGKHVYGNSTGFRMSGEIVKYERCDSILIDFGPIRIFHSTLGVWDIMKILPEGLPKLDGVISLKTFHDKLVTLDLANEKIILERPSSYRKRIKAMTLLQSRFATGPDGNELTIFINISRNNHRYWFLFDSGNLDHLILSNKTVSEWGVERDTLVTVEMGKHRATQKVVGKDIIYDGALNYALLSNYVFTINFQKKQIWVSSRN
jgi:hypothetical protein